MYSPYEEVNVEVFESVEIYGRELFEKKYNGRIEAGIPRDQIEVKEAKWDKSKDLENRERNQDRSQPRDNRPKAKRGAGGGGGGGGKKGGSKGGNKTSRKKN